MGTDDVASGCRSRARKDTESGGLGVRTSRVSCPELTGIRRILRSEGPRFGQNPSTRPFRPRVRRDQACDGAQGSGLAAAAGAEHGEELAVGDVEVDVVYRDERPEGLGDAPQAYVAFPVGCGVRVLRGVLYLVLHSLP